MIWTLSEVSAHKGRPLSFQSNSRASPPASFSAATWVAVKTHTVRTGVDWVGLGWETGLGYRVGVWARFMLGSPRRVRQPQQRRPGVSSNDGGESFSSAGAEKKTNS